MTEEDSQKARWSMHFDVSKYKGLSIVSFDLEEMTGRDSLDAAARAIGPKRESGSPEPNAFQINIQHKNNLIAQSISKVNGKLVQRPCSEWEDWNLKTQDFILAAYTRLNEATDAEVKDFIKAHFDAPAESSEPNSSGSGSTSSGTYAGPVYPSNNG